MSNKLFDIITKISLAIAFVTVLLYAAVRIKLKFFLDRTQGDEPAFLEALEFFKENGYAHSVQEGSSIVFNLLNRFFDIFSASSLMSMRITSLFFGLLTFYVIIKASKNIFKLPKNYHFITCITVLNAFVVTSVMFIGINDTILYFLTGLFLYRFYKIYSRGYLLLKDSLFIGIILGCMLLTRMMSFLLLVPVGLAILYLFYKEKISLLNYVKRFALIGVVAGILIALFNYPSLSEGKGLSFHQKPLDKDINWVQLQYLTALELDKGTIKYGQHVPIEGVKEYLRENGEDSLPTTMMESLFFDFSFTVKEFFIDLSLQAKPITRVFGIILFFLLGILIFGRRQLISNANAHVTLIFGFTFVSILSFIVVTYVEPRWYIAAVGFMSIAIFRLIAEIIEINKNKKLLAFLVINLQCWAIIVMNLPYIMNNIKQLI